MVRDDVCCPECGSDRWVQGTSSQYRYRCLDCDVKFNGSSSLDRERTPRECPRCGRIAPGLMSIKSHWAHVHEGNAPDDKAFREVVG